jgi:hypothetical protein
MRTSRREEWLDFWERRELPVLTGLPYLLLTLCTGFDLLAGGGLVDLVLAVSAGAVMATIDVRDHRSSWTDPQTVMGTGPAAIAFLIITALSAALVIRQPLFGFYVFTGYFWAWRLLKGRVRFAGMALVAGTVAISQTGGGPYRDAGEIAALAAVWAINAGVAGTLTWFGWVGDQQHGRRAC